MRSDHERSQTFNRAHIIYPIHDAEFAAPGVGTLFGGFTHALTAAIMTLASMFVAMSDMRGVPMDVLLGVIAGLMGSPNQ